MQLFLLGEPRRNEPYILVIDDEDSIRRLLQATLRRAGYRVLVASNGAEGVTQFTAHQAEIDLVVTDLMMPGPNGRDFSPIHAAS